MQSHLMFLISEEYVGLRASVNIMGGCVELGTQIKKIQQTFTST